MIRSSLIIFSPLGRSSLHPRSPSPPIKSHYRNFVQVRVPSRPLTASGNQQRLSDLTELRQLYSNRWTLSAVRKISNGSSGPCCVVHWKLPIGFQLPSEWMQSSRYRPSVNNQNCVFLLHFAGICFFPPSENKESCRRCQPSRACAIFTSAVLSPHAVLASWS